MKFYSWLFLLLLFTIPLCANIHKISEFPTLGWAQESFIIGDLAYVTDGFAGFEIIDISNPITPIHLGTSVELDFAIHITVAGNYAYVSCQSPGLYIFDIADSHHPQLITTIDAPGFINTICISENRAYVATDEGLSVIDVTNPQLPQLLITYEPTQYFFDISVVNGRAYVTGQNMGLRILDITNPQNIVVLNTITEPALAWSVETINNIAYIYSSSGLKIYDVSDPLVPQSLGQCSSPYNLENFIISDGKAYGAFEIDDDCKGGIIIFDISNPASPYIWGSYYTPSQAITQSVSVKDNIAYITTWNQGLQIIDASDASDNPLLGSFMTSGIPSFFEVNGYYAYCVSEDTGLQCINVDDANNPQLLGQYECFGMIDIHEVGSVAYIACGSSGLVLIDLVNPSSPTLMSSNSSFGFIRNVELSGEAIFAITSNDLKIIDISDPYNTQLLSSYQSGFYDPSAVAINGTTAYLVLTNPEFPGGKLDILDISDLQNPLLIHSMPLPTWSYQIAVYDHYVFLTNYESNVSVIDVSNPQEPVLASSLAAHPTGNIRNFFLSSHYLFTSDYNWNEINVFDIEDGYNPIFTYLYRGSSPADEIFFYHQKIYTINCHDGLRILDSTLPSAIDDHSAEQSKSIRLTNYPNPFNPSTTLSFDLPNPGRVKIDIFNIRGQKVISLLDEFRPSGSNTVSWNGKDNMGSSLASDVYFAKIESNGKSSTRKLVLVK